MSSRYSQPDGEVRVIVATPNDFDIDASPSARDSVLMVTPFPVTITGARLVFTQSVPLDPTPTASVQVGVTVGGAEIVPNTTILAGKSVGNWQELTLNQTVLSANTPIVVRHTGQSEPCDGRYFFQIDYVMG